MGNKARVGLIDGDIVAYRCAASAIDGTPLKVVVYRMEDMLDRIFLSVQPTEYKIYLSGGDNYRKILDPTYKANRKNIIPPVHLKDCREYLATKWKATITDGIEADDALGIEQCYHLNNENIDTVICSIDKDLLQIPGMHHNFLHERNLLVTPLEGLQSFYRSLLIGDTSDNVKGVAGLGKVKSARIIDHLKTEEEMFEVVKVLYKDNTRLVTNCNLLWIQRKENEIWSDRSKHLETAERQSKGQELTEVGQGQDNGLDRHDPRRC
jgi:5'-3' exonuclease